MKIKSLLAGLLVLVLCGCTRITAQGEKVGSIIKLSQQGLVCKTWEGEMVRGGLNGGSGGFSITPLHFTVNDPGLLAKVQDALENQYEVKVHYVTYAGPFPCSSDSGDLFLTSIERQK